jgi:hypothetical protein
MYLCGHVPWGGVRLVLCQLVEAAQEIDKGFLEVCAG